MYLTYFNGNWTEGNTPLYGAMDNSLWLGSTVFDGARSIGGKTPDLRLHLQRVINSSKSLGLECPYSVDEMEALVQEGIAKFPKDAELYVRPLVFGTEGLLISVPEKSGFALTLFDAPLPGMSGFSACSTDLRRPDARFAPTDAKASCLYAHSTRVLREATAKGFDNAVMCDPDGNVAEFATANIFFVAENGDVVTPVANGAFLSGITRARVIQLLADDGIKVIERTVKPEELLSAREIFNTGNYGKVTPCIRYLDRQLPVGPVASRARELYMNYLQQA